MKGMLEVILNLRQISFHSSLHQTGGFDFI